MPDRHLVFVTAKADTAAIREVTHLGKPHLVVPVVMIAEGVMNGALYRSEVMEVGYGAWNGKPTVYRHPERGGLPVSANEPSVYEEETLGTLFSTKVESQKLKAEMYLDVERIEAFGGEKAETLTRLQSGDPVEVSTGFWAVEIQQGGTFGGTDYTRVATAIFPDHLAILAPDQTGACSVEDGCGAPRINQAACSCGGACRACKPEETDMPEPIVITRKLIEEARTWIKANVRGPHGRSMLTALDDYERERRELIRVIGNGRLKVFSTHELDTWETARLRRLRDFVVSQSPNATLQRDARSNIHYPISSDGDPLAQAVGFKKSNGTPKHHANGNVHYPIFGDGDPLFEEID